MKNTFIVRAFLNIRSYSLLLLIQFWLIGNVIAAEDNLPKKLLPPPTPTVVLTLPSGSTCYSVLTASGCGTASTYWYTGSSFYSSSNPLTVVNTNPVILKAVCYDGTFGSYSSEYKAIAATFTEITPTGNSTICAGSSILLNASSAFTGLTYQWKLSNSNISGATNTTYSANTAGNYTLFASNGSCSSTSSLVNVSVTTPTMPLISTSFTGACGSQTITLSTQSLPSGTFQWKLGGSPISGATSSSYSTSIAGSYTVDYTYNGCTVTSSAYYFNQNAAPTITLVPEASPSCNSNLTASGCSGTINWYKFTIANNVGSGNTYPIYQNDLPADYFATCTTNSCTSPTSNIIKASSTTFAEIIPKYSVVCTGTSLLNASSANTGLSYQWQRNNSTISGATSASYSATLAGQYTVVTTLGSCSFTSSSATVISDLVINSSATGVCGSQTVTLSLPTLLVTGTYQWKLNGSPISGATSSSYTTTAIGTYTVDYTYNGCTVTSLPYIFSQNAAPTIALIPPVSQSCSSTLNATGCSGVVRWYRNTGSSWALVTTINPYTFPVSTNVSEYRATCFSNTCESLPSNVVSALPNNFTEITPTNPTFCSAGSVLLNASSTFSGLTYQWKLNGSNIANATNSSYTTSTAGTYSLVVTSGSCSYTSAEVIASLVTPTTPIINASFAGTCGSQTVTLSTQSLPSGTFQWKLNGIAISGATSSSYNTTIAGSYTVDYTYLGCTVTSTPYVFIQNTAPTIALTAAVSPSCNSLLTATGCSGTVYWYRNNNGNWVYANSGSPYSFPISTNPPEYRATCYLNSCEGPVSNVVKATPNNFTEITPATSTICSNASALLNASSATSGLTYQWSRFNSNISGATSATYSTTLNGDYRVVVTKGSCSFTSSVATVTVTTAPVLSITSSVTSPATITNGESLTLTANGCSGGTIAWSNSATTSSITVSPSSSTTYTFTCTASPCTVTSSGFVINVNPLLPPILSSTAESTCSGTSVTLTATGCPVGSVTTWNTSPTQTGGSISVSPTVTTSYTATCTLGSATSANSTPLSISVFNGAITSLSSGNWNNPATWSCNCVPAACNNVTVDTGHVVTIPISITGRLNNLTLKGSVEMKSPSTMAFKQ